MTKKETLGTIMKEKFFFDVTVERIIYANVCHAKIKRKHKKLLANDVKFTTHDRWVTHIKEKYSGASKENLKELLSVVTLLKRNSKQNDGFFKEASVVYLSSVVAAVVSIQMKGTMQSIVFSIVAPIIIF